jgi:hypothetical protein
MVLLPLRVIQTVLNHLPRFLNCFTKFLLSNANRITTKTWSFLLFFYFFLNVSLSRMVIFSALELLPWPIRDIMFKALFLFTSVINRHTALQFFFKRSKMDRPLSYTLKVTDQKWGNFIKHNLPLPMILINEPLANNFKSLVSEASTNTGSDVLLHITFISRVKIC